MDEPQETLAKFGKRLRQLRQAKGLSQEAFASLCGLDRTYISGVERGVRNVSLLSLHALAKGLDVSLSDLMAGV